MKTLILLLLTSTVANAKPIVGGDSIGLGLGKTEHVRTVAIGGVQAHQRNYLHKEFGGVPNGSTLILSLGTNDAFRNRLSMHTPMSFIATQAKFHQWNVVWIGAPKVFTAWNARVAVVDHRIQRLCYAFGFKYINIYNHIGSQYRTPDGVHFTTQGYRKIWRLVRQAIANP